MEENYKLAFETVSKRFERDDKLFYFYVTALYGLLSRYSDYKDIVIKVFNKCSFYLESGSMDDIFKRHNINNSEYDDDYIADSECNTTFGVSNQGHEFYIDENGNVSHRITDPFIACPIDNMPVERLLNTFCHEMGHLIKGEINGYEIDEDDDNISYYIRTGLAYFCYEYDKKTDELSSWSNFSMLDEAINTIQTTEVMREILSLKDISVDDGLSNFVNSLDEETLLQDMGYEEILGVVKILWNNSIFRELVNENIVTNGAEEIATLFDKVVGEDMLAEFDALINDAFSITDQDEIDYDKIDELLKKAGDIAKKFNLKAKTMIKL